MASRGTASGPAAFDVELAPEILELLERSAAMPHGLAFVHCAPCECVAAALGVHPDTVDRTRDHLDHELRATVIHAYARALERRREHPPAEAPAPSERAPRGAAEVIVAAKDHALGLEFLMRAPLETAAIMFGVHPDVVVEARDRLSRRTAHAHVEHALEEA